MITASSKVAPRSATTVPRLELCTAVSSSLSTKYLLDVISLDNSSVYLYTDPGLIVWQISHQPNWTRQNFSPTKELILIYLLKKP